MQESETIKKLIKDKVDIKNMYMGITKLRKRNKSTVMECETEEEMKKLKYTVQDSAGWEFQGYRIILKVLPKVKPKMKIVNIDIEELKVDNSFNSYNKKIE